MKSQRFYWLCCVAGLLISLTILYTLPKGDAGKDVAANFKPQTPKTFQIDTEKPNSELTVKATTLPQFVLKLVDEKFQNLWIAEAKEKPNLIKATLVNAKGDANMQVKTTFDQAKKQVLISPMVDNKVKPGLYTLLVTIKSYRDGDLTITQDFTWGVLAIDTNKGIYQMNEPVKIGMAVLGNLGNTKCKAYGKITFGTADVWLTIISPSGKKQLFSTKDNTIAGSSDCADRSVTNNPDFSTTVYPDETGKYTINMDAETVFGRRSISSTFTVQKDPAAFDVERTVYPIRIYPRVDYPVTISVQANQDYSGSVYEIVPASFKISNISDAGTTATKNQFQTIAWQVHWQSGHIYKLSYTIHFPQVAPEFYLVGPLTIGKFSEGRIWKIASDSIFQMIQEAHNTGSGLSVSATFPVAPTQRNLGLVICSRTTSATFNRPTNWTLAYNNGSGPRIYMYYIIIPANMSPTVSCTTSTSGVLAIQLLEFSGNSTSSVRDARNRRQGISCTSGSFTSASITPTNPDELIVSATSSTTARTVNSHTNSFVDSAVSFNGSSGTFDSGWVEAINNPPVSTNDTVAYSGSAGTCDSVIVSFNPTITVAQGSYRFYDNADSTTPGNPLAASNTPIYLNNPQYPFRLRILLDIDSPSGTTIGLGTGDWILEYAPLPASGNCADGVYNPVGEIADGTPIAYNPNPSSGGNNALISSSGNDPVDGAYTTVYEDYIEDWLADGTQDVTNNQAALANNQAGLFDFSLIDNSGDLQSTTYCLIVANGDGSLLDAYRNYPEITTIHYDVRLTGGTTIKGGATIQ